MFRGSWGIIGRRTSNRLIIQDMADEAYFSMNDEFFFTMSFSNFTSKFLNSRGRFCVSGEILS